LRELLTREELTDIGVAELCREAGVHRTTFYGHYAHVGDVAADMYANWIDHAAEVAPADADDMAALARLYRDATASVLESVLDERPTLRGLLTSEFSLSFRRRLFAMFRERCAEAIERFRENGLEQEFDEELASSFVSGGIVGAVFLWVFSDDTDVDGFIGGIYDHMPPWWPRPEGYGTAAR
jgi:AcrR family transcriptional regulator